MTVACGRTALLEDEVTSPTSMNADASPEASASDASSSSAPDGEHVSSTDNGIDVANACLGIAHNIFVVTRDDGSPPILIEGEPGWREAVPGEIGWQLGLSPPNEAPWNLYATTSDLTWDVGFSTQGMRKPLEQGRLYSNTHGLDPDDYSKPNAGFQVQDSGRGCAKRGRFEVLELTMVGEGASTDLASFTIAFEYSCGDGERFNHGCIHMTR